MKIKLIVVSDSDKHFQSAIGEYEKRLGKELEIISLAPVKNGTVEQIKQKETENIIKHLQKDSNYKIMMSLVGKKLDTIGFKKIIEKYNSITYIIGGPYGINESLLDSIVDEKISLSDMTFPHGLAKLCLLEQIYRSKMIVEGRQYHY